MCLDRGPLGLTLSVLAFEFSPQYNYFCMSELALTEIPHPLNTRTDELGSLIPDETVRAAALEQYEQVFFAGWRWNGVAERFFTTNALANFINSLDASQLPFVFGDLFRYKAALQVSAASETPGSKLPHDRQVQKKLQACDAFSDKVFSKLVLKLRPQSIKSWYSHYLACGCHQSPLRSSISDILGQYCNSLSYLLKKEGIILN